MSDKIRISDEKVNLVKAICEKRTSRYSAEAILKDLRKFIREELKEDLKRSIQPDSSMGFGEEKWKDFFRPYEEFNPSITSLKNAFYEKGVTRKFQLLPVIVDSYINRFEYQINDITSVTENKVKEYKFSSTVETRIADFVNSHCSCPECYEPTKAPVLNKPGELIVLGRACLIYGPEKDAPRYNPDIVINHYGAENGIWLCSKHADMVNGQGSADYSAEALLSWRHIHHTLVYARVTGIKQVIGLGFNYEQGGVQATISLLNYINDQGLLFFEPENSPAEMFTTEVNKFRDYLEEEMQELKFTVFLARQVSGMIYVCKAFTEMAGNLSQLLSLKDAWLVFRKVVGSSLGIIAKNYKVTIPSQLCFYIPVSPELPK